MNTTYRGRFAPSPTGPLHFGSLVAAVASYLEAKSRGGEWLVRIDDLDAPRTVAGAADEILRTLAACGMQPDGPLVCQSSRTEAYSDALARLRALGKVYACACSRREIADSAVSGIEGPIYPGTCRNGVADDRIPRALRVDTRGASVVFDDAVQGRIEQNLETEIGDFVVLRADQVYAYQLVTAVDDAAQGITDVVRGADLLESTPRQIYLLRLLGLPVPRYMHVPVALNDAGEKLSKQTHADGVDAQRPLPALLATLAFLGQQPPRDVAGVRELWAWAIDHWRSACVPHSRGIACQRVLST